MVQAATAQGQSNPFSQIAFGRPSRTVPVKLAVQLPLGVWLPSNVKFTFDAKQPPIAVTYKRCLPAACFADVELKDDLIKKIRDATDQGTLEFDDSNARPVKVPVSFKGFAQALRCHDEGINGSIRSRVKLGSKPGSPRRVRTDHAMMVA
jgi:invasion protein IalB